MRLIPGVLGVGVVGLCISSSVLYFTEQDAIAHSSLEVRRHAKKTNHCHPNPGFEGHLVYAQCTIDPTHMGPMDSLAFSQHLKKPMVENVISAWFSEHVEMFQWKESKAEVIVDQNPTGELDNPDDADKLPVETEILHTYTADWYEHEFYVSNKKHDQNPKMEARSQRRVPFEVSLLGGYNLHGTFQVPKLREQKVVELPVGPVEMKEDLPETRFKSFEVHGDWLYALQEGSAIDNPQIGDQRVRFIYSTTSDVTILAEQVFDKDTGDFTFIPWRWLDNPLVAETRLSNVNWIHEGHISFEEMITIYGPPYNAPKFRGLWKSRMLAVATLAASIFCLGYGLLGYNASVPVMIAFATISAPLVTGVNVQIMWAFALSGWLVILCVFPTTLLTFCAIVAGGLAATKKHWSKPLTTVSATLHRAATQVIAETHVETDADQYVEAPLGDAEAPAEQPAVTQPEAQPASEEAANDKEL